MASAVARATAAETSLTRDTPTSAGLAACVVGLFCISCPPQRPAHVKSMQRSTRAPSCANASVEQALDLGCPGGARILVGLAPVDEFDDESHADHFLEAPLQIHLQLRAVDRGVHELDQHRHLLALLDAHALDDADIFAVAAALGGNDAADRFGEDIDAAQLHHRVVAAE